MKSLFSIIVVVVGGVFAIGVPLYRLIVDIRNQIFGGLFNVPPWVIGLIFLIPTFIKIARKIFRAL